MIFLFQTLAGALSLMFYPGVASKNGSLTSLPALVPLLTLYCQLRSDFLRTDTLSERIISLRGYFLRTDIFSARIFSLGGYFRGGRDSRPPRESEAANTNSQMSLTHH